MLHPKRIGTQVLDYSKFGSTTVDTHPVYEYRGFYIARGSAVAHSKIYYYDIYREFQEGKLTSFDFYLNPDRSFNRLHDAVGTIDSYLSDKERMRNGNVK